MRLLLLLLVFLSIQEPARAQVHGVPADPDPAKEGIDRKLPNVLIIGDSISLGYTPFVAKALKGKANLFHCGGMWNENASSSSYSLGRIDAWLAFRDIKCKTAPPRPGAKKVEIHNPTVDFSAYGLKWDVITCNWGLWEIINDGKPANAVPIDRYAANLKTLFEKMNASGARIVWTTTTPVPETNKRQRREKDVIAYNAAARKIADAVGATSIDLHALIAPKITPDWRRKGNAEEVHFSEVANRFLADHMVKAIEAELATRKAK